MESASLARAKIQTPRFRRGLIERAELDARVFEFLDHLLEGLPQDWTLAIATRVEPPLALWRWRARREVAEFDETLLRFSRAEVEDLLRHATGRADPEQAMHLLERTQGWAAGLSLSLEASKAPAAADQIAKGMWHSRRHLFDDLAGEVFEDLPAELQEFLLRCSLHSHLPAGGRQAAPPTRRPEKGKPCTKVWPN